MTALEVDPAVKVIVFASGKKDFIVGADIKMFKELAVAGREGVRSMVKASHPVFDQMASGKPKIAAINGSCLGGGAEFALACHYRIAATSASMGFPEVMLGLLPGFGGTQRLPALIGLQNAMPMLMTGSNKKGSQAKKMKLVDQTCDQGQLMQCAMVVAKQIADGTIKIPKRGEFTGMYGFVENAIRDYSFVRDYVFSTAKKQVMKMTLGNYPAPLKIIDVLKKSVESKGLNKPKGYDIEADGFSDLCITPQSQGLQALFFAQTAAKKNPYKNARPVKQVGVLGAGLMGAGIAEVTITKDIPVVLKDVTAAGLAVGETSILKSMQTKVKRKRMSSFDAERTLSKLIGVHDGMDSWKTHIGKCDMVIEAVFENLALKHKIVEQMESVCKESCIIATNTSSLPVADIAAKAARPENIVGMHYFSPVPKMQLLEIIPHDGTSEDVIAAAVAMGLKQGKLPIVCKDVPGFFVNRCLGPYIDETICLILEMDNMLKMDKAMKAFGFPVGPLTLADEAGVEVAFHLHANLQEDLGVRVGGANRDAMKAILDAGIKGKRFNAGLLSYPSGKKPSGLAAMNPFATKPSPKPNPVVLDALKPFMKPGKVSEEDVQQRIQARFVNETVFCLQDGVIKSASDGDVASIFGIGFPPFTGGPFRYIDSIGTSKYVDQLNRLADQHGPRFAPAPLLVDMAKTNKKFHP